MKLSHTFLLSLLIAGSLSAQGSQSSQGTQKPGAAGAPTTQAKPDDKFGEATQQIQERLQKALIDYAAIEKLIQDEQVKLYDELNGLEQQALAAKTKANEANRSRQNSAQELANLKVQIKARRDETNFLQNNIASYIKEYRATLHVAELQRYIDPLEAAAQALENGGLEQGEIFEAQAKVVEQSLDRIDSLLGGTAFAGRAVSPSGSIKDGTFTVVGPVALFVSDNGLTVGTAEQELGPFEPVVKAFGDEKLAEAAKSMVQNGEGSFPFDPTLGNAHKLSRAEDTLLDEIEKGGFVMYPILGLAAAALLVALFQWYRLSRIQKPSKRQMNDLFEALESGDEEGASAAAHNMRGPVGRMLSAGVGHLGAPKPLIEEVMYEVTLTTRMRATGLLPFIAIAAASAPLLGLLGTVTGIINTFKLITEFGTGDPKTLSGGISEALLTTKFGLIVAIPSLLLHAYLSRKARGVMGQMETAAIQFLNHCGRKESGDPHAIVIEDDDVASKTSAAMDRAAIRAEVKKAVSEMVGPLVEKRREARPSGADA